MQGDFLRLPLETSYQSLENINKVKFTRREIDVVACIISGRAATKTIASFLSIESKTVEVHTRNIRLKLECNSRENIVQFIEKAGKFSAARQHYLLLLIQFAFEQKLQQISSLVIQENLSCLIVYEKPYELFIEQLRKYFKCLGIEGVFRIKEADKPFNELFQDIDSHSIAHCLFVTSSLHFKQLLIKESLKDASLPQFFQKPEAITFISWETESETKISQEKDETYSIAYICFGSSERYYLSFFDLLKRVFPDVALDTLTSEFKEQYEILTNDPSGKTSLILVSEGKELEQKEQVLSHVLVNFLKKRTGKLFISGILCLSVFCTLFLVFKGNKPDQIIPLKQVQQSKPIRSDLPLPHNNVLLKRPEIMKHIEEKLKRNQGIQTVALVGMGGAGKTTVARHYAHQQNADVIWEMNAETKGSLISSFENLAYALAKTEDEKKILRGLQEIKDSKERIEKILSFTKERLKTYPNWFLVYDNVEKFSDIQKYFPTDTKIWGRGKVILTTRDSNIANNSYIHHAFPIGELSEGEKLSLFMNIMSHGNTPPLTSAQKEQAQKFLTKIPPFPLDISAAAHYLRTTGISYQEYLEHLRQHDEDFENTQQNILTETSEYDKTRYGIITLSLKKLIGIHNDFKELLLFISLINSQNIPRDLLNAYKNNSVVDNFIWQLKKFSFITSVPYNKIREQFSTFSVHRVIQTICSSFLLSLFNEDKKKIFLDQLISVIEVFYEKKTGNQINSGKNCLEVISSLLHLESLIKNLKKITVKEKYKARLFLTMGYAHRKCTRNLLLAKKYLIQAIKMNSNNNCVNNKAYVTMLKDLATICVDLGDFDEALIYCQEIIKLSPKIIGSEILIIESLVSIGVVYSQKGNFEKSNYYFEAALNKISKVNDSFRKKEVESEIYEQLASLYSKTYINNKKSYKAEKYLLKSLEILNATEIFHNNIERKKEKLSCYVSKHKWRLGQIYNRFGQYKKAAEHGFEEVNYIKNYFLDDCPNNFLLNAQISLGMAEVLLREGKLEAANSKLTEHINTFEKLMGEVPDLLSAKTLRAEVRIRLDKLTEAYEDCLSIFSLKKISKDNYSNLMYLTCFYHCAVIKYKQKDMRKSLEYFSQFFKSIEQFCKIFFDEKVYNELKSKGVFTNITYSKDLINQSITTCFQKSAEIFSFIYGISHPFVNGYVIKNYH